MKQPANGPGVSSVSAAINSGEGQHFLEIHIFSLSKNLSLSLKIAVDGSSNTVVLDFCIFRVPFGSLQSFCTDSLTVSTVYMMRFQILVLFPFPFSRETNRKIRDGVGDFLTNGWLTRVQAARMLRA